MLPALRSRHFRRRRVNLLGIVTFGLLLASEPMYALG
jgi:hypothetical protein